MNADPMMSDSGQQVFRALLHAMAEPGRARHLTGLPSGQGIASGLAAVLHTLLDAECKVGLWHDVPEWRSWLREQLFVDITGWQKAEFVLARSDCWSWSALTDLWPGSEEAPESSATLILECGTEAEKTFLLSGPGIDGVRHCQLPLPAEFVPVWQHNASLYPRGMDVLLVMPAACIALPRTVRVQEVC